MFGLILQCHGQPCPSIGLLVSGLNMTPSATVGSETTVLGSMRVFAHSSPPAANISAMAVERCI
jgi:hypothetical protein